MFSRFRKKKILKNLNSIFNTHSTSLESTDVLLCKNTEDLRHELSNNSVKIKKVEMNQLESIHEEWDKTKETFMAAEEDLNKEGSRFFHLRAKKVSARNNVQKEMQDLANNYIKSTKNLMGPK